MVRARMGPARARMRAKPSRKSTVCLHTFLSKVVVLIQIQCRNTFQNDYEITSKSKFWSPSVQNSYLHHPALSNNLDFLICLSYRAFVMALWFYVSLNVTYFNYSALFLKFLAEIHFRTIMKLPQKASFGTKMCRFGTSITLP